MTRRRATTGGLIAAVLAAATLSGCLPTSPDDNDIDGFGDFGVAVTRGTAPEYGWLAGPANRLRVIRVLEPHITAWEISRPGGTFEAPVAHGVVPDSVEVNSDAETLLTPGVLYRVEVYLPNGRIGRSEFVATND